MFENRIQADRIKIIRWEARLVEGSLMDLRRCESFLAEFHQGLRYVEPMHVPTSFLGKRQKITGAAPYI